MIGAQLVTADGDVLELGPGQNEDLFWAIRGGGGNFGVVTRLDFRLHPLRTQHRASFQFGWNDIAGAMRIFGELIRETPDEVRASIHRRERHRRRGQLRALWRSGCRDRLPREVEGRVPIGGALHAAARFPRLKGRCGRRRALAVDGAFLEGMTDDGLVDVLARAAVAGRGVGAMLMGLSNGVASRIGMTDTAYPLRGTGLSSLLSAEWHRPEERARAEQWVAEYGAALRPWARRAYVNYLAPSSPERIREVYGVNYSRLARIKAQYDPANLFRSNQNVLPARGS